MGEQAKSKMELIDDGFDYVLLGASRMHESMRRRADDDFTAAQERIVKTEAEAIRSADATYNALVREGVEAGWQEVDRTLAPTSYNAVIRRSAARANEVRTAAIELAHQQAERARAAAAEARAELLRQADAIVCEASDQIDAIRDRLSAKLTELAMQNPEMVVLLDEALAEMGMPIEVVPLSAVQPSDDDVKCVASLYGEDLAVARAKLTSALAATGGDTEAAIALLVAEAS